MSIPIKDLEPDAHYWIQQGPFYFDERDTPEIGQWIEGAGFMVCGSEVPVETCDVLKKVDPFTP